MVLWEFVLEHSIPFILFGCWIGFVLVVYAVFRRGIVPATTTSYANDSMTELRVLDRDRNLAILISTLLFAIWVGVIATHKEPIHTTIDRSIPEQRAKDIIVNPAP